MSRPAKLAMLCALYACGTLAPTTDAATDAATDATIDAATIDAPPSDVPYQTSIQTDEVFLSLADSEADVKYTIQAIGRTRFLPETCVFPDSLRYPYHLFFLRQHFPEYASLELPTYASFILNRATRRAWGGIIRKHPTTNIYAYSVYQESIESEDLTNEELREFATTLSGCAPALRGRMKFLPYGRQVEWSVARRTELTALGIDVVLPSEW